MASVTGMTAEAIDEKLGTMVISIRVDELGQVIFKKKNGEEVNGGVLVAPTAVAEAAWPVNSLYSSTNSTDPSISLGVGTWIRYGKGRVMVSLDEGQMEFDAPGETGGTKSVILSAAQSGINGHSHAFSGETDMRGLSSVSFSLAEATSNPDSTSTVYRGTNTSALTRYMTGSGHTHTFSGATAATASAAASESHTNLQPYITVYVWKRTA
jgi:microcystin-dependent protein